MSMKGKPYCAFCGDTQGLTFHHLIPKSCHRNKWFRKRFGIEDMRSRGITLCRQCHAFLHRQFSEKELGRHYNTIEKILATSIISRYVRWAKRKVSATRKT